MKSKIKGFIQTFLKNVLGIQIYRVKKALPEPDKPQLKMQFVHDPAYSYMILPEHQEKLYIELAQVVDDFSSLEFEISLGIVLVRRPRILIESHRHTSGFQYLHQQGSSRAFQSRYDVVLVFIQHSEPMLGQILRFFKCFFLVPYSALT